MRLAPCRLVAPAHAVGNMSHQGYAVLAIGVVVTLTLGIGLMGLVFELQPPHGYDEGVRWP
jgi:hypothetical protein